MNKETKKTRREQNTESIEFAAEFLSAKSRETRSVQEFYSRRKISDVVERFAAKTKTRQWMMNADGYISAKVAVVTAMARFTISVDKFNRRRRKIIGQ